MRIPNHVVDRIYQSADILEVVQEYVQLKRRGTNWVGLSPFKQEKTPSFYVSPSKNIFKDFSSGKGGNAVSFLMEMEGLTYRESLERLAEKYGIDLELEKAEEEDSARNKDHLESLRILNQWVANWFQEQLTETEVGRQQGLAYFNQRGFSEATRNAFLLGYSPPDWEALTQAATQRQFRLEDLLELGLSIRSEKNPDRVYDRFRERVMFPLQDANGRVVGFAGRILDGDKKAAKYVNSPESVLYNKRAVLYGLFQNRQEIRTADRCYLVEGYTDVLSLHQAGVRTAVASSGTALTEEQIRLLRRYTRQITVLFDGDAAGQQASLRGIDLLLAEGMQVRALPLPPGQDPDSYVTQLGGEGFVEWAESEAVDFLRYKIRVLTATRNLNDPIVRTEVLREAAQTIAKMPDELQRAVYAQQAAQEFGIGEEMVQQTVERQRVQLDKAAQRQAERQESARQQTAQAPAGQSAATGSARQSPAGVPAPSSPDAPPVLPGPQYATSLQEKELCRLMLNYFDRTITLQEAGEDEPAEYHVPDYILAYIEQQPFADPLWRQVRQQVEQAVEEEKAALDLSLLLSPENPTLRDAVAELLSVTEHLSPNWAERMDTPTPDLDEQLAEVVQSAIYYFQLKNVDSLFLEVKAAFAACNPNDTAKLQQLHEQLKWVKQLENELCSKHGAVVRPLTREELLGGNSGAHQNEQA